MPRKKSLSAAALHALLLMLLGMPPTNAGGDEPVVVNIRLMAYSSGHLSEIKLDGKPVLASNRSQSLVDALQEVMVVRFGAHVEQGQPLLPDAILECDENLRMRHVVEVINALNEHEVTTDEGVRSVMLIKQFKFAPPAPALPESIVLRIVLNDKKEPTVVVGEDQIVSFDEGAKNYLDEQASRLRNLGRQPAQVPVELRASKSVPVHWVQSLIQSCQQSGFEKFRLRALPD